MGTEARNKARLHTVELPELIPTFLYADAMPSCASVPEVFDDAARKARWGEQHNVRTAKRICRACPYVQECLEHALEHREPWGVWGGKTAHERRAIARKRAKERQMG